MKKKPGNSILFICFAAVTGGVFALLVWLYLRIANIGVSILWDMVPKYVGVRYRTVYTILMCLFGGLVIGIFHRSFGPWPESMADSIRRVRETRSYPFEKLPVIVAAAFLPLLFGGAVGPESGLVSLLLGLCFWTVRQFGMARWRMETALRENPDISRGYLFREMLSCLILPANKIVYDKNQIAWKRPEQIGAGITAGVCGLIVYEALNTFLGRGLTIPHLTQGGFALREKLSVVLMIAAGIGAGYLFLFFRRLASAFFSRLAAKNLIILNAVLGGLVLGLIGSALPMTMFSGSNDMQAMQYEYLQYRPELLILIGVVKLFLTNVCIESGWRGGHFFPVIFSGISIGSGFSELLGTNEVLSAVLVTAALLGTMLQQPFGAIALSVIFFPWKDFGWICLASAAGGCIPVPKTLRMNPENKGFLYNMTHRKSRDAAPRGDGGQGDTGGESG